MVQMLTLTEKPLEAVFNRVLRPTTSSGPQASDFPVEDIKLQTVKQLHSLIKDLLLIELSQQVNTSQADLASATLCSTFLAHSRER